MARILHLADLHLGWTSPWDGSSGSISVERNARLGKAVDYALQNQIDVIIIAGDLFETHTPAASLVREVKGHLARAIAAGIHVVTVPGNHDEISYPTSVYRHHARDWPGHLVQHPHFEHTTTLETAGQPVHIYALAYTGGLTQTHPPLSTFARTAERGYHIAVLHGSVDFDAGDRSLPIDLRALGRAGFDYCALGHIHQHKRFDASGSPVVYAGMIEGKNFDDPGVGHYTVVQLGPEHPQITTPCAGARRIRTVTVDAGAYRELDALFEWVDSQVDEGDVIRLRLQGSVDELHDVAQLEDRLAAKADWVEVVDEREALTDEALRRLAQEPTVRGHFVARFVQQLEGTDDDCRRHLLRRALFLGLRALEEARR